MGSDHDVADGRDVRRACPSGLSRTPESPCFPADARGKVDYDWHETANRLEQLADWRASQVREYARFRTRMTGVTTSATLFFKDGQGGSIWIIE